jgi:hypothetical protein
MYNEYLLKLEEAGRTYLSRCQRVSSYQEKRRLKV